MAPIPGVIREAARFENHSINWTDYGTYTKVTTTDKHISYNKLANFSHKFQDRSYLPMVIGSVLFAMIVVGIVAHFCFWGRHRYVVNILFVIARGHSFELVMQASAENCISRG